MSSSSSASSSSSSRASSPFTLVQPDHFFSLDNTPPSPSSPDSDAPRILTPEQDPLATRGIPVFKPTMEEFADFEDYMNKVESWGMHSGIIKIIPPKEWSERLPSVVPQLANVKIKSPIEQEMMGSAGLFRQHNIEKKRHMSMREWVEQCRKDDLRAPSISEVELKHAEGPRGRDLRSRRRRNVKQDPEHETVKEEPEAAPKVDETHELEHVHESLDPAEPQVKEEEVDEEMVEAHDETNRDDVHMEDAVALPPTPASQAPDVRETPEPSVTAGTPAPESTAKRKRRPQTRANREAAIANRAKLDSGFLEGFNPRKDWLPEGMEPEDYSNDFCAKLERRYWRNCGLGRPPWYGADMAGSVFTDETTSWNVAHLKSALSRLLPVSAAGVPGVNTPYLYFGMWRATFAWHVEDMDLFSINYIHFGAPKFWYAIPQGKAVTLENIMKSNFPQDVSNCSQFLRHKSFLASPTVLAKSSCRPNCLVQRAGEFVITFPRGYHAGFNLGLNCAESVNFALESWLEIGRKAKACGCVGDSVRIDVDELLRDREIERLAALAVKEQEESQPAKKDHPKEDSDRKRKPENFPDEAPPKRKRPKPSAKNANSAVPDFVPPPLLPSIFKITLKVSSKPKDPEAEPYPCCLCISRVEAGLLPVHDPPSIKSGCTNVPLRQKPEGETEWKAVWRAHEMCAKTVTETWVDEVEVGGETVRYVFGVDSIVKDRWNLKCSACTKLRAKTHGAPIQCTKGKCPKAFHVSCAQSGASGARFHVLREVDKNVCLLDDPNVSQAADVDTPITVAEPLSFDLVGSAVPQVVEPASLHLPAQGPITQPGGDYTVASVLPQDLSSNIPADSTPVPSEHHSVPLSLDTIAAPLMHEIEEPGPKVLKTIRKIEFELFCNQHNPDVAQAKKDAKLNRTRDLLLKLPEMARIKLRVTSGLVEVSLVRVIEERNTVEVLWDGGLKKEFKWGSVVWGSTEGQNIGQKPSVAAPLPPLPTPGPSTGPSAPKLKPLAPIVPIVPLRPIGLQPLPRPPNALTHPTTSTPGIPTPPGHYPYTAYNYRNFTPAAYPNATSGAPAYTIPRYPYYTYGTSPTSYVNSTYALPYAGYGASNCPKSNPYVLPPATRPLSSGSPPAGQSSYAADSTLGVQQIIDGHSSESEVSAVSSPSTPQEDKQGSLDEPSSADPGKMQAMNTDQDDLHPEVLNLLTDPELFRVAVQQWCDRQEDVA